MEMELLRLLMLLLIYHLSFSVFLAASTTT